MKTESSLGTCKNLLVLSALLVPLLHGDTLYVGDVGGDVGPGSIYTFTSTGVQNSFASGLGQPISLAFDSSGNLFEAEFDTGQIRKFTPGGIQTIFASGLNRPFGLAFDNSGNLFESDSGSGNIYKFTPGGIETTFASGVEQSDRPRLRQQRQPFRG